MNINCLAGSWRSAYLFVMRLQKKSTHNPCLFLSRFSCCLLLALIFALSKSFSFSSYFFFLPFLHLPLSWNMLVICIIFCSLDKTISILELVSSDIEVLISNFWSCFIYIPEDLWPMSGFIFKPQSVAWFIPIIIVSPLSSPSLWFLTAFCAGYMSYIISLSVCISHQCLWVITLYSSKKVNGAHLFSSTLANVNTCEQLTAAAYTRCSLSCSAGPEV